MVVIRVVAAARPHSVSVHPTGTGQASPLAAHPVSAHTHTHTHTHIHTHTGIHKPYNADGQGVLSAEEFVLFPHRMTVLAWLALFLSWGSLGLETATVVVSRPRKNRLGGREGGIGSEWDCHGGIGLLQLRKESYRRPSPDGRLMLCVCVCVCV